MKTPDTLEQIIAEGKRLLEAGDKTRANAFFVTATQLNPNDKTLWQLRAETAPDPIQVAECLEQILALDPDDAAVRDKLVSVQMNALRAEVKTKTERSDFVADARKNNGRLPLYSLRGWIISVAILSVGLCGIVGLAFGILAFSPGANATVDPKTPTDVALVLPATWTPTATRVPTNTPTVTPTPVIKVTQKATVRSGPGTNYPALGTLGVGSIVIAIGRSADSLWLQIPYPDPGKPGWILATVVDISKSTLAQLAERAAPPAPKPPTARPTTIPTSTPVPSYDFQLGRSVDYSANCSLPWKIAGTVYDSASGARRLNGILVRIWAFNQLQGTLTTGSVDQTKPGYWEWTFNPGVDINGQVAVVNADGSLRSAPVSYHLTGNCSGSGAVNQIIVDFTGK